MVHTVHMGYASLDRRRLVTPHALDKRVKEINTMVPLYMFLLCLPAGLALIACGSVLALTTSAASAGMACNYPPGSNTCLTIEFLGAGVYRAQVGIDIHMSQQDAQAIIDHAPGRNPFVGPGVAKVNFLGK